MVPTLDNARDQVSGTGTIFTGPGDDPGGRPFQIFLVRLGHVFSYCRMAPSFITSHVTGDTFVFEQYLHGSRCQANINVLFGKLIRNAVMVVINGDVIVDVDRSLLPLGVFISLEGKRFQGRFVDALKEASPGAVHLFKRAAIELDKLFGNGLVEIFQTEEAMVPQSG
jgi:hypothetical protein